MVRRESAMCVPAYGFGFHHVQFLAPLQQKLINSRRTPLARVDSKHFNLFISLRAPSLD